jgi:penicillin-binding protein 1C
MEHISGVTGAAPIMHEVLVHLHQCYGMSWYVLPENVVEKPVHLITGKLLAQVKPDAVWEKFMAGQLPPLESPQDFDSAGRVRLAPLYSDWFATGENWLAGRAVVEALSHEEKGISLIAPLPGTTYYLDPDLPASSRRIDLRARGFGALAWESDSLVCQSQAGASFAILAEGEHRIRVRNPATGEVLETWIVVKTL